MDPKLTQRVRGILGEIIAGAFPDAKEEQMERLKSFRLDISDKPGSYSGSAYIRRTCTISIQGSELLPAVKACLHELAHHADNVLNSMDGHSRTFYECLARLLHSSLDLKIFKPEDFCPEEAKDGERLAEILASYEPKHMPAALMRVRNCYHLRAELKKAGFRWNEELEVWEKESDPATDAQVAEELGISPEPENKSPWYAIEHPGDAPDPIVTIPAYGNTYSVKDALKEYHFYFDSEKKLWVRKVQESRVRAVLDELSGDARFSAIKFYAPKKQEAKKD